MNELEKFLDDTKGQEQGDDPFAYLNEPPKEPEEQKPQEPEEKPEDDEEGALKPRNRRERRLEARLQAEREAGMQLAARLEAMTETQRTKETEGYLSAIERIYGTDSPEAREATDILRNALAEVKEAAKREALETIEQKRVEEVAATQEAEEMLDEMLYEIEDEFNVDLTSKEAEKTRTDFYRLLERMSPKDRDGNIVYYADHIAVWETLQARSQREADNTARNLAARSMATGNGTANSNLQADAHERLLREHGII